MVTTQQLQDLGASKALALLFTHPINDTLAKCEINTPLRIQHFLAQLFHESGRLFYVKELANGQAYEGRVDLGNTHPGDGVKFKGRGLIQITGRSNYTTLGQYLGLDLISHPELLEDPENAALSAGWFWTTRKLNLIADKDDVVVITKRVNGALNGIEDRRALLTKAKTIFK